MTGKPNPYRRFLKGQSVDVYDILTAFEVTCPATQHAMKKLFALGARSGGKTKVQDLEEAIWSLQRAVELEREKVKPMRAPMQGSGGLDAIVDGMEG